MLNDKVIHIMANNYRLNQEFWEFIHKNFERSKHLFVIYNQAYNYKDSKNKNFISFSPIVNQGYLSESNVVILNNRKAFFTVLKQIQKCKQIIMHGWNGKFGVFLTFFPGLINKTCIIPWGADFFSYPYVKKTLKKRIGNLIKKRALKKSGNIAFIDYNCSDKISQIYNMDRNCSVIHYYDSTEHSILNLLEIRENRSKDDEINILLCNNAQETNKHIEALEKLLKYKDENIKIHIILVTGGTKEYIEKVSKIAKELFGNKAILYYDMMSQNNYYSLMNKMDVAVFSNLRLQGAFSAYALLYTGCKLYCRENNGTCEILKKEFQCKIYDYSDVGEIPFDDFVSMDKSICDYNREQILRTAFNEEYSIEAWRKIFK